MSMSISRASYTGDPGIFGDIWGGIKGAITGGIKGVIGVPVAGPGSVPTYSALSTVDKAAANRAATAECGSGIANRPCRTRVRARLAGGPPQIIPAPGIMPVFERFFPGGSTGMMPAPAMAMGSGYHLNKSSYFLLSGEFVPEGTRMVKNRKRNPANSRATSRAISRVVGAKKYAASLSRISIRASGCAPRRKKKS